MKWSRKNPRLTKNKRRSSQSRKRSGLQIEALEPRQMLSANAMITGDFAATINDDAALASGTLTVSDPDGPQEERFNALPEGDGGEGQYGFFTIDEAGNWEYDPARSVQGLAADQTLTDQFTFTTVDGTTAQVTVTIQGTNSEPVFSGDLSGTIFADQASSIEGRVLVDDADDDQNFVISTPPGGINSTYGNFEILDEGNWTYTVDTLAASEIPTGETVEEPFTVTSADGTTTQVVISIIGVGEGEGGGVVEIGEGDATIGGDLTFTGSEDDLPVGQPDAFFSGTLTVTDPTNPEDAFIVPTPDGERQIGQYGTFETFGTTWRYFGLQAAQTLNEGVTVTDQFTVVSGDGTEGTVSITIEGRNDLPTISGSNLVVVDKDETTPITGQVIVEDVDSGESGVTPSPTGGIAGTYGTLNIQADGNWVYDLDTSATETLYEGMFGVDELDYTTIDGTVQQITIRIRGAGFPESSIRGTFTDEIDEDSTFPAGGSLFIDGGDNPSFLVDTATGTLGEFSIGTDGRWFYELSPAAQSLNEGDVVTETFPISTDDGVTAEVVVTVTGVNDVAKFKGFVTPEVLDGVPTPFTGNVEVTDPDEGEAAFVPVTQTGAYGTLQVEANGDWTYRPDTEATDSVPQFQFEVDEFSVASVDGTETPFHFRIKGVNDTPQFSGRTAVLLDQATTEPVGTKLTVVDPDIGESFFIAETLPGKFGLVSIPVRNGVDNPFAEIGETVEIGRIGEFVINTDGEWTYQLTDLAAARVLPQGVLFQDIANVRSADGTPTRIIANVFGLNDDAQISGDFSGSIAANATQPVTGQINVDDIDATESNITESTQTGNYGEFTITADGAWSYTVDNSLAAVLGATESPDESFTVSSVDGTSQTVTITVAGRNEYSDDSITTDAGLEATINVFDNDSFTGAVSVVAVSQPNSGTASFAANGDVTYSPAAGFAGSDTFTVTIEDAVGNIAESSVSVVVNAVENNDPVQVIDGVLTIVGEEGTNNQISVRSNGDGELVVTLNDSTTTIPLSEVESIAINGSEGNDRIIIQRSIDIDATIRAGAGNDLIISGRGDDLLDGGEGNDVVAGRGGNDIMLGREGLDLMLGGGGRDVIIGGDQQDLMYGQGGQDLLIGGTISFADDDDSLNRVRDEWASDNSFNDRLDNILNGTGDFLDGLALELGETVFSDGFQDFVFGGRGRDVRI